MKAGLEKREFLKEVGFQYCVDRGSFYDNLHSFVLLYYSLAWGAPSATAATMARTTTCEVVNRWLNYHGFFEELSSVNDNSYNFIDLAGRIFFFLATQVRCFA